MTESEAVKIIRNPGKDGWLLAGAAQFILGKYTAARSVIKSQRAMLLEMKADLDRAKKV